MAGTAGSAGNAAGLHDYGLRWVDNERLYLTVERVFSKALGITGTVKATLPPDPFLIVVQCLVTDTSFAEGMSFEEIRKVNKTLSNAVGNMHQEILGIAPHWESLGRAGGVLDIRTKPGYVHPRFGKPVVAEVKNRFNTIKQSDEKVMWDKIDNAARLTGSQGYLFQIIPETAERYDCPWEPSGRAGKPHVRVCDGATAYEIVFGHRDALHELYGALPTILEDVRRSHGIPGTAPAPSASELEGLYRQVVPN